MGNSHRTLLALALVSGGCTAGGIVDGNFDSISNLNTAISFINIDRDSSPATTKAYTTSVTSGLFAFDGYAPEGAVGLGNVKNSATGLQPGEYYVSLETSLGSFYMSSNFMHSYDGSCTDDFTKANDQFCEQYYVQLDNDCKACAGPSCAPQPLSTHNGYKVIVLCAIPAPL